MYRYSLFQYLSYINRSNFFKDSVSLQIRPGQIISVSLRLVLNSSRIRVFTGVCFFYRSMSKYIGVFITLQNDYVFMYLPMNSPKLYAVSVVHNSFVKKCRIYKNAFLK